jgi:ABC-type uncharacterized transport system substrate-binding protein
LGLRIQPLPVRNVTEFDSAFSAMVREGAGAALALSTPHYMGGAKRLAELGIMHRVPTMFGPREHVDAGGLLSYSPDRADLYRRAAGYADRILKGAKPAEMPVEQAIIWERLASA